MKFLSGVIAICCAFWMHIYLVGEIKSSFYVYAIILFLLGVWSLYLSFKEKEN
ncbi:hypothetical protein JTF06_05845 [Desemzia sp. RIT804]|uniref:hypothetical protein n=1 Tax=Desemzia sp. RIT 804 TaxID=2810209 RepID=UPI00194E80A6|nr:hypothetical protein [Desemzia sp. RIT 804]MBM6614409.1 hypothetical protein [Desemzia sp. RIT 804]